ncbi:MAG: ATP-binding protein [Cyclobacteriaceae bacterium]
MVNWIEDKLASKSSRSIYYTNLLSLIFSGLTFGLAFVLYYSFGWTATLPLVVGAGIVFCIVIVMNKFGYVNAGRMLFCILPVWGTLTVSVIGKLGVEPQSYIVYFDSRYILLASSILPAVVFDLKERWPLYTCLASTAVCILFFDPIHNWLNIGYYQRGFDVPSYYYINYVTMISYVAILAGVFILKLRHWRANEKAMRTLAENARMRRVAEIRSSELEHLSQEMESQNEELIQQQEELVASRDNLEKANRMIHDQNEKLETYAKQLSRLVEEKSGDLQKSNEELIKSNNELRQFSFTVSHNLRGPVARLLGLTNLLNAGMNQQELPRLVDYIRKSASELDGILSDLTHIIDIRSELYRVKERINIAAEWQRCVSLMQDYLPADARIETVFDEEVVYGIKPMFGSIMLNLLTNSIKYRSSERSLVIHLTSRANQIGQTVVEVRDNGTGFDLASHQENVFKLYKRFHTHVNGKGLGLYLVKNQIEIMGGRVEVESEPDKGALFRLVFPTADGVSHQVFFENDASLLYYDAVINNTVIIWKKNVTSAEYRNAFERVLQTLRKYNTTGWIADLRNQGRVGREDQSWFLSNILKSAADNGLKRIAAIGFDDPIRKDYYERMIATTKEYGIVLQVFYDMPSALNWMKASQVAL